MLTVRAAPFMVTVLAVAPSVDPAPDVSQFPATVHVPEVVIVPEEPPVMVTFVTLTVDVPAVSVAPLFTVKFPPVPVRAKLAVARVAALLRVRVPAHRIPFVAIVKVAAAVGLNCTLLNSATPRLPKVMTRETGELKRSVAVRADQYHTVER